MPSTKDRPLGQWLWDLIPVRAPRQAKPSPKPAPPAQPKSAATRTRARDRYGELVALMKRRHAVRIRKWRSRMTGCAWQVQYADGSVVRLIEAPYPRSPISVAVFLHEVGHHAIGFSRYKPRCLEELKAWEWALAAMEAHAIPITDKVQRRVESSLRYAVAKAQRRGIKRLPEELKRYAH